MKPDPETHLRNLRLGEPPPDFLARTLAAALEERSQAAQGCITPGSDDASLTTDAPYSSPPQASIPRRRKPLLAFIPRPLRWPLAACWFLILLLRMNTPQPIPAATLTNFAERAPTDPAAMLACLEETRRLAHELLDHLRRPVPPL